MKVRSAVTVGSSPVEEIIKFADNKQIDIIIMGSQRLETISKIKALVTSRFMRRGCRLS